MRFFVLLFLSGCIASFLSFKPNVVVFFTDDQGTLDAGCYGSDDLLTPGYRRLAETEFVLPRRTLTPCAVLPGPLS